MAEGTALKLNLGCGEKKVAGYLNVDNCGAPDFFFDLSQFPWPWADESVDEVFSEHFLEHVLDYEKTVLEMHRILKKGGIVHFRVPHHRSPIAVWHLHKWAFSVYTPELLCVSRPYQWGGKKLFTKIEIKANVIYLTPFLNRVLTWFANIAPYRWDFLGFPIDEVEFRGEKCKVDDD